MKSAASNRGRIGGGGGTRGATQKAQKTKTKSNALIET